MFVHECAKIKGVCGVAGVPAVEGGSPPSSETGCGLVALLEQFLQAQPQEGSHVHAHYCLSHGQEVPFVTS